MTSNRVLIVANRLPVTVRNAPEGVELVPSSGGLATGLRPWHERSDGVWFGWPGDCSETTTANGTPVDENLQAARMIPVHLSANQVDGYYYGFANQVLWPLFRYSVDRVPVDAAGWAEYQDVNETFATEVAREYRPGDIIWVHDYHLMLLPALLRQRLPRARIGFFLHVPFPSPEVFRVLPSRREILHGVLGADLVGFHTFGYMRHFMMSLLHVGGIEPDVDRVRVGEREVKVGVFPMGVDAASFATLALDPQVRARVDAIRRHAAGRRIILGVDRLDYTKGIPRRLQAIAEVLTREPALRDRMRYLQIAIPSRGGLDSYERFRRDVEETVGRLNGSYGTLQSLPIHYVHQTVSLQELVALYCAADVMLVTPLRDGMNLVAKEFAASRVDEDGVLVLSEFAGAATELQGAVTVNPYDVHTMADSICRGLSMPVEERRARMHALRRRVCDHDVFVWADRFVQQLDAVQPSEPPVIGPPPERSLAALLIELRRTTGVRLLLDYDGTLVPLARSPALAAPDDELLLVLEDLASLPGIQVDIVSGRPREALEQWFGDLPVSLWAEHGFWHRYQASDRWDSAAPLTSEWMRRVRPILDQFAATTPGARVEVKTASMVWHYRDAARDFGLRQAHELRLLLGDLLSNQPVEVLEGKKVIEVRLRGVDTGIVAQRRQAEADGVAIVAIGDDRSDEDLFRALPRGTVTVSVGGSPAAARFQLDDYRSVRMVLRSLIEDHHSYEGGYLCEAASA
jgi:trehalose 6-phosphate synthase/phosphatase